MAKFELIFETLSSKSAARIVALGMLMVGMTMQMVSAAEMSADPWTKVDEIVKSIVAPQFPDKDFLVTSYGAVGDGKTMNTEAFSKAITACNAAGGGNVIVADGKFLTGAIHLKSNVNLHVAEGATILFSTDPKDYLPLVFTRWEGVECMNYSALIYAFEQENIAVSGKGTLDGQASVDNWWPWKGQAVHGWKQGMPNQLAARKKFFEQAEQGVPVAERVMGEGSYLRPNFWQPYRCKNVLIEGVTILRSPMWELHPVLCENVIVSGVTIDTHGPNNDGCDPESCKNVLIENCIFDTGDDCIALKSGRNADGRRLNVPIENVVVRNCQMKDGHGGVVIGSEISGGARNIFAENCQMDSPILERMLRLKTNSARGGVIENVYMRNVTVGQVSDALVLADFYYEEGDGGKFTPTVRNVLVQNVTAKKSNYGLFLRGYERSPVTNIRLENCVFEELTRGNRIEYANDVTFANVLMNGKPVENLDAAINLVDQSTLPPQAPPESANIRAKTSAPKTEAAK